MTVDWDGLRGDLPSRRMNARSTAALLDNPGCTRRAVLDAANIDTAHVAGLLGGAPQFGQSPFALGQGNRFERRVKADGYIELVRALAEIGLQLPEQLSSVAMIGEGIGLAALERRAVRTSEAIAAIADGDPDAPNVIDHAVTRLIVDGEPVYLEQDALAFRHGGQLVICEVKGFPIIDGTAEPEKVGAAARQSAVYVASIQDTLHDLGLNPGLVSTEIALICPRNYTVRPTAAFVDVGRELRALRRQLSRRVSIEDRLDAAGIADTVAEIVDAETADTDRAVALVSVLPKRYEPLCLSKCDMARLCRKEARNDGDPSLLGDDARNLLAGLGNVAVAVAISNGAPVDDGQDEVAVMLRRARQSLDDVTRLGGPA